MVRRHPKVLVLLFKTDDVDRVKDKLRDYLIDPSFKYMEDVVIDTSFCNVNKVESVKQLCVQMGKGVDYNPNPDKTSPVTVLSFSSDNEMIEKGREYLKGNSNSTLIIKN